MDFLAYLRNQWLSQLPIHLVQAILTAALFELLVYVVNRRIEGRLGKALSRDADAEPALRIRRKRIVLGLPQLFVRTVLYIIAILIILRIFGYKNQLDLYPVLIAVTAVIVVGAHRVLRDIFAGYLIHYDYLYAVGDRITVGDYSGTVTEIALRYTVLRTRNGQQIVVRHSDVRNVTNHTRLNRSDEGEASGSGTSSADDERAQE